MKRNAKRALSLAFALALVLTMTTAALAHPSPGGSPCNNTGVRYNHISTPANSSYSSSHQMASNDWCFINYYTHSHTKVCNICTYQYPGTYDKTCKENHSKCDKGTITSCN